MSERVINYNEMILKNYQNTYPNLAEFSYDERNDALVYEGNFVKLNGYGLSRIDPVFFNMNPEDIYIYFKNGFYTSQNKNAQIENYLSQFIITEDEEETIKSYVSQYIDKLNIYARNIQFFDNYFQNDSVKSFINDLMAAKSIVEEAKKLANSNNYNVYQMIVNAYDAEMDSMNQNQNKNQNLDKGMSLTRNLNSSIYSEFAKNATYLEELKKDDKLGMAGYTSIILIIASAVTFGIYLAVNFLG